MAGRSPPSFYKILFDPSAPHLSLPANFVSKHLANKIPENPVLRSANGRFSWKLKIAQINGDYCFTDGWNNVVNNNDLGFGDFLVFRLVDQSTFKVSVYSPNGCEKHFISKTQVEYDEDVDDDDEDDNKYDEYYEEDGKCDDDGDPFFMTVITKTHKNLLRLKPEFMELAGIDGKRRITLKNPDGKEWQLGLQIEQRNQWKVYYLSSGWREFQRCNELCEGDECVFKFSRSEGKLCLVKVTRKEAAARQPSDKVKVAKRKRGPPVAEGGGCLEAVDATLESEVAKKKRGRPQKTRQDVIPSTVVVKRKRGRPPKEHNSQLNG